MAEQPLAETNAQLTQIEDLMASVESSNDARAGLLREHLQSARCYLLGAMPVEYVTTLELAQKNVDGLSDARLRHKAKQMLTAILEDHLRHHAAVAEPWHRSDAPLEFINPADKKTELADWFTDSATSVGVLYPTHYILAIFPSAGAAKSALATMRGAAYDSHVARLVSASEFLAFMDRLSGDKGIWGNLMTRLSRIFDTEATFADRDIRWAERGAAFLAIRCTSDEEADRIKTLLVPLHPIEMQWYLAGGIRSLI
jgi:hypothetical protein